MPSSAFQRIAKVIAEEAKNLSEADKKALKDLFENLDVNPFPNYVVEVDYSASIEKIIAIGKYDWVDVDITSNNFPLQIDKKCQIPIYLLNFGDHVNSKTALKKMDVLGFRPANIKELLALGAQYPDLQRKESIVALGSTWLDPDGDLDVPCLNTVRSTRCLNLAWFDSSWILTWKFAAVLK